MSGSQFSLTLFFLKIFTALLIEEALETREPNRIENHRNKKHW